MGMPCMGYDMMSAYTNMAGMSPMMMAQMGGGEAAVKEAPPFFLFGWFFLWQQRGLLSGFVAFFLLGVLLLKFVWGWTYPIHVYILNYIILYIYIHIRFASESVAFLLAWGLAARTQTAIPAFSVIVLFTTAIYWWMILSQQLPSLNRNADDPKCTLNALSGCHPKWLLSDWQWDVWTLQSHWPSGASGASSSSSSGKRVQGEVIGKRKLFFFFEDLVC